MSFLETPSTKGERNEFLREYTHYIWADHTDCSKFDVLDAIAVSHPHALDGAVRRNSVAMVRKALRAANEGKGFIPKSQFKRVHGGSKKVRVTPFITTLLNSGAVARGVSVRKVTGAMRIAGFQVHKSLVGAVMKEVRPQPQPPILSTANLDSRESSPVPDQQLSAAASPPILTAAQAYPPGLWDSVRPSMDSDVNLSDSSSLGDTNPFKLPPGSGSNPPDCVVSGALTRHQDSGYEDSGYDGSDPNPSPQDTSPISDGSDPNPSPQDSSPISDGGPPESVTTSIPQGAKTRSLLDPTPYDSGDDCPRPKTRVAPRIQAHCPTTDPSSSSSESSSSSSESSSSEESRVSDFLRNAVKGPSASGYESTYQQSNRQRRAKFLAKRKPKPKPWQLKGRCALGMFVSSKKTDSIE